MKTKFSFFISIFLLAVVTLSGVEGSAQDVQFALPYSAPLYFNPAFAGSAGCSRVAGIYRNQWPNISGQFISTAVSYDQYIKALHGGVGINYYHDGTNIVRNNRFSGIYSAHIPVIGNKWVLKPAIEGTYGQNIIDWSHLTFAGTPVNNKEVITYPDFSAAILMYSEKFYGGFSAHHVGEPETSFSSNGVLPRKYTGHIGANIHVGDSGKAVTVSPSMLYVQQEDFRSVLINCAVSYDKVVVAIGYKERDNMIVSLGFRAKSIRIAYGYDWSVSKSGNVSGGSHEVSLSLFFNHKHTPDEFLSFDTASF